MKQPSEATAMVANTQRGEPADEDPAVAGWCAAPDAGVGSGSATWLVMAGTQGGRAGGDDDGAGEAGAVDPRQWAARRALAGREYAGSPVVVCVFDWMNQSRAPADSSVVVSLGV